MISGCLTISDDVSAIMDGDGAILLDARAGKYYSLNRVAAEIWRGIEQGRAVEDVIDELRTRYARPDIDIAGDLDKLVTSMQKLGLVTAA